jgi:hypothetical protein
MSVNGLGIIAIAISLAVSGNAANPFLSANDNKPVARFGREAFNQVVVAIFPKMQSDNDTVAYTQRVPESDSIRTPAGGEDTGTDKAAGQEHPKRHVLWLLLFFGLLVVLSLLFGLHRTARRGVSYSKAGAHWTIDWRDVVFFWLDLILSGGSSSRSDDSGSSSSSRFSGGGGSFGGSKRTIARAS